MKNVKFISAGAGTGKTFRLTTELVNAVLAEANLKPSNVVITTYTKAAAVDVKKRSFDKLVEIANSGVFHGKSLSNEEKKRLLDFAIQLDAAKIGDIHSLCFDYLRKYALFLGLDPNVRLLDEASEKELFNSLLLKSLQPADVDYFYTYQQMFDIKAEKSDNALIEGRDDFWLAFVKNIIRAAEYHNIDIKSSIPSCETQIDEIFNLSCATCSANLATFLTNLRSRLDSGRRNPTQETWYNNISGYDFTTLKLADLSNKDLFAHEISKTTFGILHDDWEAFKKSLCQCETFSPLVKDCMKHLMRIAEDFKKTYANEKRKRGVIDYNDMELLFEKLLDKEVVTAEMSKELMFVMVDEFQDCNPIQLRIFDKLSDIVGTSKVAKSSIWVGDSKQAIYQFRGADSALFNGLMSQIHQNDIEHLSESWRSRLPIINLVNKVFEPLYPNYTEMTAHRKGEEGEYNNNEAIRHWVVDAKDEYASLARHIKKFVDSKAPVKTADETKCRPVKYGDIAILMRSSFDVENIEDALKAQGITVKARKNTLNNKFEVELVKEFIKYLDDANYASRAALLHMVVDVPTADLLRNRVDNMGVNSKGWLDEADFLKQLDEFRQQVSSHSVAWVLKELVSRFNLMALVEKWGYADQRRQRLMKLVSAATEYENQCVVSDKSISFKGFLVYMSSLKMEMRVLDSDAVTVTTYHNSKGLQWPVVILDSLAYDELASEKLTKHEAFGVSVYDSHIRVVPSVNSSWYKNMNSTSNKFMNEKRKEVRSQILNLLYVGMTRARDYIISFSRKDEDGKIQLTWLNNVQKVNHTPKISEGKVDVWNIGSPIPVEDLVQTETENQQATDTPSADCAPQPIREESTTETIEKWQDEVGKQTRKVYDPLFVTPSDLKGGSKCGSTSKIEQLQVDDFLLVKNNNSMTDIGTCVHNIYAAFNASDSHEDSVKMAKRVVEGFGFTGAIDPEMVIASIEKLYQKLGISTNDRVDHERPFTVPINGQLVRGEIDLLWHSSDGKVVLVDFKNSSHSIDEITDQNNGEAYFGKYFSQIEAYKAILSENGEEVADALLYYPRYGLICRF